MEKFTFIIDINTKIKKNKLFKEIVKTIEDNVLSGKDEIKVVLVDENNIQGINLTY